MSESPPRIQTHADMEQYIAHFNARRYEQQMAYYAPDVIYKVGSLTLTSPQQIVDFYADFHQHVKERMEIVQLAIDGDTVAAVIRAVFEPTKDYVRNGLLYKVGAVTDIVSFVFYRLSEGRIHRVRMTRYPGPVSDFAS
jgi:hypothetical protein